MRITVKAKGVGRRIAKRAQDLLRSCLKRHARGVDGTSLVLAPASTAGRFRAILTLDEHSSQRRVTAVHGSANGALTLAVARGFEPHDHSQGGGR